MYIHNVVSPVLCSGSRDSAQACESAYLEGCMYNKLCDAWYLVCNSMTRYPMESCVYFSVCSHMNMCSRCHRLCHFTSANSTANCGTYLMCFYSPYGVCPSPSRLYGLSADLSRTTPFLRRRLPTTIKRETLRTCYVLVQNSDCELKSLSYRVYLIIICAQIFIVIFISLESIMINLSSLCYV